MVCGFRETGFMALERDLNAVPPTLLTVDGSAHGVAVVASTCGFFVKQQVTLQAPSLPPLTLEVKRVVDYTTLWLGIKGPKMTHNVDLSAYTVALGSFIFAEEQSKATLSEEARNFASYIQEPSNSWRSTSVDCNGNPYGADNPLPVVFEGSISIGAVEVKGTNGNFIEPNPNGSINVNIISIPTVGNVVKNIYSEANSVASGATTILVQYTVPLSITDAVLERISVSGENIAKFTVFVNGTQIDTRRTFYGSSLSEYFEFTTGSSEGFILHPADLLVVKVLHTRPYVGDFEGRIQVLEIA